LGRTLISAGLGPPVAGAEPEAAPEPAFFEVPTSSTAKATTTRSAAAHDGLTAVPVTKPSRVAVADLGIGCVTTVWAFGVATDR